VKDGIANKLGILAHDGEVDPETTSVMVDMLKLFARSGGRVELNEWLSLDDTTKSALAEAFDEVFAERSMMFISSILETTAEMLAEASKGHVKTDAVNDVLEEASSWAMKNEQ